MHRSYVRYLALVIYIYNIGEGVGVKTTAKTEKMKQLEFSFRNETGRVFAMESVEEVVAKWMLYCVWRGPEEEEGHSAPGCGWPA